MIRKIERLREWLCSEGLYSFADEVCLLKEATGPPGAALSGPSRFGLMPIDIVFDVARDRPEREVLIFGDPVKTSSEEIMFFAGTNDSGEPILVATEEELEPKKKELEKSRLHHETGMEEEPQGDRVLNHHIWIGNVWWNTDEFVLDNLEFFDEIIRRSGKAPIEIGAGTEGIVYNMNNGRVLKISTERYRGSSGKETEKIEPDILFKDNIIGRNELMIFDQGTLDGSSFPGRTFSYYIMETLINERELAKGLEAEERDKLYFALDDLVADDFGVISASIRTLQRLDLSSFDINFISEIMSGEVNAGDEEINYLLIESKDMILEESRRSDSFNESVLAINKLIGHHLNEDWLDNLIIDYIIKYATGRATDLGYFNMGIRPSTGDFILFDYD